MKVKISRLEKLLSARGFVHYGWKNAMAIAFGRPSTDHPLVEWIQVDWAGKKGEAVYCNVGISTTKYVAVKGLIESKLVFELAEIKERGWTIVETDEAARAWESRLVEVAPDLAAAFAKERAPILLQRTDAARSAASKYLALINDLIDPSNRLMSLEKLATAEMRAEAERLAGWPGVLQVFHAEDIYAVACLAIMLFQNRVEPIGNSFIGQDPLENRELMWRIQLIADHFLIGTRNGNAAN